MSTNEAKKIAKIYADFLKENRFNFSRVFLFGSHAKGTARKWSDIDVCVISDKFKGKSWYKNERQLWHWRQYVDPRLQPIGMTENDFKGIDPLADEIKKTGIRVA